MPTNPDATLGYMKYCGDLVENGVFDARKSAQALIGFDQAIRFFAHCQNPGLQQYDFELPVKIKHGSWEVLIPEIIELTGKVIIAGATIFTGAYLAKAGQKMAENDFKDVGFRSIIKKSVEAIQWAIQISKHLKTVTQKQFDKVEFKDNNRLIGIPNEEGELLWVPEEFFNYYSSCPHYLLSKLVELVEDRRSLSIGRSNEHGDDIVVSVTNEYKKYFLPPEELDVFFPELVHGMQVTLNGEITRGNESTNNMGFRYQGIILTIEPENGTVVQYKDALYLEAEVQGKIDRKDSNGELTLKKPKIIFKNIRTI